MRGLWGLLALAALTGVHSPAEARWAARQAGGMAVSVYTPAAGIAGQRGLLVVLHGCAQSADALRQRAGLERAAEDQGVVIATPSVPGGGVYFGCWDYYGANHGRQARHVRPLLALVEALQADGALGIDPGRVWIAGLSSGGGQAAVMGCVAPDVFAGVGVAAGPAVGTSAGEIARVATDVARATADCRRMAGAAAGAFDSQLFAVAAGSDDFTVAPGYAAVHAGMAAALYGAVGPEEAPLAELPGVNVRGRSTRWRDAEGPRVARLELTGLGHAWPAGGGGGQTLEFVAQQGLDFGLFLARFFSAHDRRGLGLAQPPAVRWVAARADPGAGSVEVTGQVAPAAQVAEVAVRLLSAGAVLGPAAVAPAGDGRFAVVFGGVARGPAWRPEAVALGRDGQASAPLLGEAVVLRDPAADAPPTVRLEGVEVVAGCLAARGTSGDAEDGAPEVRLRARSAGGAWIEGAAAVEAGGAWSARLCGLEAGCWEVEAVAHDSAGQSARAAGGVVAVGDGGAVEVVESDLNGHLPRYGTYALGYGVADLSYVDLLSRYGLNAVFPLYLGVDGRWYHNLANLPGAAPPECAEGPPPDGGGAPEPPRDAGPADAEPERDLEPPDLSLDLGLDLGPPDPSLDLGPPDLSPDFGLPGHDPSPAPDRPDSAPDADPDAAAPEADQAPPRGDRGPPLGPPVLPWGCAQAPPAASGVLAALLALGLLRRRRR